MPKLSIKETPVGGDLDVADRTILRKQPRRMASERLPFRETSKNIGDGVLICVELGDVASDEFLGSIAQQVKLSLVGAENGPVAA